MIDGINGLLWVNTRAATQEMMWMRTCTFLGDTDGLFSYTAQDGTSIHHQPYVVVPEPGQRPGQTAGHACYNSVRRFLPPIEPEA